MEDLQIAYYFAVIMIGFAALAIAGYWALKTRDVDLRNFCVLYALFTLVLILSVLRNYLSLNVEGYASNAWHAISGISLVVECAVIVALNHFLVGIYQIPARKLISVIFLVTFFISVGLIYSPIGATLDGNVIHFGIGFKATSLWYLASFTIAIVMGFGLLRKIWKTEKRNFVFGSLIFAVIGYIEAMINFPIGLRTNEVTFGQEQGFLYSSIPYALYGLFLIYHFLTFPPPTPIEVDSLSESFLSAYGITEREREIIQKVIEGKSNAAIASELFISLATVKTHLHNIYTKLGVESRFDLLARLRSAK